MNENFLDLHLHVLWKNVVPRLVTVNMNFTYTNVKIIQGQHFCACSAFYKNIITSNSNILFIFRLNNASYLNLPSSAKDGNFNKQSSSDLHSFSRSNKEVVIIKSLLCSTKLTQNSMSLK